MQFWPHYSNARHQTTSRFSHLNRSFTLIDFKVKQSFFLICLANLPSQHRNIPVTGIRRCLPQTGAAEKRFKNFRKDQDLCLLVGEIKLGSQLSLSIMFTCATNPQKNSIPLITYSEAHLDHLINYQPDWIPRSIPHCCRQPASGPHASSCNLTLNPALLNSLVAAFGRYSSSFVRYNSDLLRNYHMLLLLLLAMTQAKDEGERKDKKKRISLVITDDETMGDKRFSMLCRLSRLLFAPTDMDTWRERDKKQNFFITQYQFH